MRISFRIKYWLSIVLVTLGVILPFSYFTYSHAAKQVENNYTKTISRGLQINLKAFEDAMLDAYYLSINLSQDLQLVEYIQQTEENKYNSESILDLTQYLDEKKIKSNLNHAIYLYMPNGKKMITNFAYKGKKEIFYLKNYDWAYQGMKNKFSSLKPDFFFDEISHSFKVSYTQPLYQNGELLAIINVNIDERDLYYKFFDMHNSGLMEQFYLLDQEGRIITAKSAQIINLMMEKHFQMKVDLAATNNMLRFNTSESIGVVVRAPYTNYWLLSIMPRKDLLLELKNIRNYFIILVILSSVSVYIIAYFLSKMLYKPLQKLKKTMNEVMVGNLGVRVHSKRKDEFGDLSHGFDEMLEQLESSLDELVIERVQRKSFELEALQYQITPHFMYNTLTSIRYAAILQGAPEVGRQIGAFINLLRASISKEGAFITVAEEINLVKAFVELQKYRYLDSFTLELAIEDPYLECYVPRLILQPLVENAILHAFDLKKSGNIIRIEITAQEQNLIIKVMDNGKGIRKEKQLHYNDYQERRSQFSGIGIVNIIDRLHLYYDQKADLVFSVNKAKGTTVTMHLPISWDEKEYEI